jgi:hypothetical protein
VVRVERVGLVVGKALYLRGEDGRKRSTRHGDACDLGA